MRTYIDTIERRIEEQLNLNQVSLIRLEGIENPIIYKEICKYISTEYDGEITFIAKLSLDKYKEFEQRETQEWGNALAFLRNNDFVDIDNAMTKWRNNITEYATDKPILMLLMGTEAVQDKGGLGDFYLISPDVLIEQMDGKYHNWFIDVLDDFAGDIKAQKAINTLFKVIYKNKNVDLIQLSNLVERIRATECHTIQEVINEICYRLDEYYDQPSILDDKKIPKVKELIKETHKSAEIVNSSYRFITRDLFKQKYLTQKEADKYRAKIITYQEDNEIIIEYPFPEDKPIFSNYNEFEKVLMEFIKGENIDYNRDKLLKVDFGIINNILKIKPATVKQHPKEINKKILGDPISIYTNMILDSINSFMQDKQELPNSIEIQVEGVSLSGCINEELEGEKQNLCVALGGLVDFIKEERLINYEGIEIDIYYKDNIDIFIPDTSNMERIEWKTTNHINDASKVKFTLEAKNENDRASNSFTWVFPYYNEWKSAFKGIVLEKNNAVDKTIYPNIFLKDAAGLFKCESDEEFYAQMDRKRLEFKSDTINILEQVFGTEMEVIERYEKLIQYFNEVINIIGEKGFYTALKEHKSIVAYINQYREFIGYIDMEMSSFTANQKDYIEMLLNSFCIHHKEGIKDEKNIVPPYHPIMLEKLVSKLSYMRGCYLEIFELIRGSGNIKVKTIEQRIQRGNQLSTIDCGPDVLLANARLNCCKKVHGYFALYESTVEESSEIYSNSVDITLNTDEYEYDDFEIKPYASIIYNYITEYLETFPARADGINITFVNPVDTYHIITAMQEIRARYEKEGLYIKINLRISLPYSRKNATNYLRKWLENIEQNDTNIKIQTYVTYFEANNYEAVLNNHLIKENEDSYDISFMYSILTPGKPEFKLCYETGIKPKFEGRFKFPTQILPEPISDSQQKRYIHISQYQFSTVKAYTELAHSLYEPNASKGEYRVQRVLDMVQEQPEFMKQLHEKSNWVVCIDEALDKNTIQDSYNKIIGFTSGAGNTGELNVTLSTREDVLEDICNKLYQRLLKKFTGWSQDTIQKINLSIINIAKDLDGSRILNALNPNDYSIYNFLAYVLVSQKLKLLESDEKCLIRVLINLDTHQHWFSAIGRNSNIEETNRPDLLLLEVENSNENIDSMSRLKIKATVIECKMGRENDVAVEKAQRQVEAGIKVLSTNWNTQITNTNQKYWFGQLYRTLVFSPVNRNDNSDEFKIIAEKMQKIIEGQFDIEWNGKIFGFWLDSQSAEMEKEELESDIYDEVTNVKELMYYKAGQQYIKEQLNPYNMEENKGEIIDVLQEDDIDEEFEKIVLEQDGFIELELENEKLKQNQQVLENNRANRNEEKNDLELKNIEETTNTKDVIDNDLDVATKEAMVNPNVQLNTVEEVVVTQIRHEEEEQLVQEDKEVPLEKVRILLGEDIKTKEKIYWEYGNKQLNNRHLLISGNSGTGKTYCIQTLMYELVTQGISCLVFDYTDGFTTSKLDPILVDTLKDKINQRYVVMDGWSLNPFRQLEISIGDIVMPEKIPAVASRISAVFTSVYKFGPQQNGVIYRAIREGLEKYGDKMNFKLLAQELEEINSAVATSVLSKIQIFLDIDPFNTEEEFSWQDILDEKGQIFVIQLTGYTREVQLMLTEFILWDIWNYCVKYGDESRPFPLIIDEAQNLDHGESSPTGKILTEGRKFGISGWFATQFLKGALKDDEIQRLQQAGQKLYFSPPEKEVMEMAKNLDINNDGAKEWAEKLKRLPKGNCITAGQMTKNEILRKYDPKTIRVISLEERASERNKS